MRDNGTIRQDLFHMTSDLNWLFETDLFKISTPSYKIIGKNKSMSLTRSRFFTEDGDIRLVLNTDLLMLHGFIPKPIDEIGYSRVNTKPKKKPKKKVSKNKLESKTINKLESCANDKGYKITKFKKIINKVEGVFELNYKKAHETYKDNIYVTKVNFMFRPPIHGDSIQLPISYMEAIKTPLEIEYEERIFKNIPNIGKYIKAIEFFDDSYKKVTQTKPFIKYLKKFPHIKIRIGEDDVKNSEYFPKDIDINLYEEKVDEERERKMMKWKQKAKERI